MGEIRPGVLVVAVVLPHRAPLALAEIRPPGTPRDPGPGLLQPLFLGGQRDWIGHNIRPRRIRHTPDCPTPGMRAAGITVAPESANSAHERPLLEPGQVDGTSLSGR